jgi:hypothetical protein
MPRTPDQKEEKEVTADQQALLDCSLLLRMWVARNVTLDEAAMQECLRELDRRFNAETGNN